VSELQEVLSGLSEEEIVRLVQAADLNGDNEIDLPEFRRMVSLGLRRRTGGY
jgi:Ca2+-binding EF-hand superfamily protein